MAKIYEAGNIQREEINMIKENLIMNAIDCGIAVKVNSENNSRFLCISNKEVRLFRNIEAAREIAKLTVPNSTFEYFVCFNGKKVGISKCNYFNGSWQYFDNDKLYIIKETYKLRFLNPGYIIFEDGDVNRTDPKYGTKRQYQLLTIVKYAANRVLSENKENTITSISDDKKGTSLKVKHTSARINIITNSKLMDINQARKEKGALNLHYIKSYDKYTTLYLYITKDVSESLRFDGDDKANAVINRMMEIIIEEFPALNPKFVPLDNFNRKIEMEGIYD